MRIFCTHTSLCQVLSLLCLVLVSVTLPAAPVAARVSGWAQWSYLDYRAEGGGLPDDDANHFTQDYALYYHSKGLLGGGRLGSYDIGVGYEWAAFDAEINEKTFDLSTGKLLYNGQLLLAPGGLPFRLSAFSYDNSSVSFEDLQLNASVLEPMVVNDVRNGQHITTGINFIAGIRNGSYLGQYRELLSKYPRIFVDYREDYIRDLESRTPEHSRDRNLAFVSLNKKNNWFHYRYREYTDFENSANDFSEKIYMLGTVDHLMRREWINLTNWIKISVDASLTLYEEGDTLAEEQETYQLNFFNTMSRSRFKVQNYNYFLRERDDLTLRETYELPFYAEGILDADRRWRGTYIAYGDDEFTAGVGSEEKGHYLQGKLSLNERERIQVAPRLELETREGDNGEGQAIRVGVEAYTNSRYHPATEWLASYRATWIDGSTETDFAVDYLEQELFGEVAANLARSWRVGGSQRLIYGAGDLDEGVMRYIAPEGNQRLAGTSSNRSLVKGGVSRSTTELFAEVANTPALSNRASLIYDMIREDDGNVVDQLILQHSMRYQKRTFRVSVVNQVSAGDEPLASSLPTGLGMSTQSVGSIGDPDLVFYSKTSVDYFPSRNFQLRADFSLDWQHGENGSATHWYLNQRAEYSFYTVNGFTRKLADVYQAYEHESIYGEDGDAAEIEFTLGGNYYLTRTLRFGAKTVYRYYDPINISELELHAIAGVDFEKLQCELRYSYGLAEIDGVPDNRNEHLFEARVKKIF